ncbi:MAG: hypothetical protein ABI434_13815 [Burkholderiaceae bacterium]
MRVLHRIVLAAFVACAIAGAWLAPMDLPATQQVDAGLKRALLSFATARALNAAISVAQGTELSVQPGGVGAIFAPGQLLDPVNDMVEQFSTLMLAASVAFGVQKVLISIGSDWPLSLALTLVALAWAGLRLRERPAPRWLARLLVLALMLRFALPLVTLGTDVVWQKFLARDYQVSQQAIEHASRDTAALDAAPKMESADPSIVNRLKGWFSYNTDLKARFADLRQAVERIIEQLVRLMVVFVLQTVVVPVLLLWLMWSMLRSLLAADRL